MFRVHPPEQSNSVSRPFDQPTAAGRPQVGQSSQVTRSLGSTMVRPTFACPAGEALLALLGAGAHANDGSVPSGARPKRRRSGRLGLVRPERPSGTQGTGVVTRLRPSRHNQASSGRGPASRLLQARYPARQGRLPCLKRALSIGQTRPSTANSGQPRQVEPLAKGELTCANAKTGWYGKRSPRQPKMARVSLGS